MTRRKAEYLTCCVNSTAKLIDDMTDQAREITYRTARRNISRKAFTDFEKWMTYDTGGERGGLRLKDDWHVTYHKSRYKGIPCYYIQHSGIEYIFT